MRIIKCDEITIEPSREVTLKLKSDVTKLKQRVSETTPKLETHKLILRSITKDLDRFKEFRQEIQDIRPSCI